MVVPLESFPEPMVDECKQILSPIQLQRSGWNEW
jgi:hypothetical protein